VTSISKRDLEKVLEEVFGRVLEEKLAEVWQNGGAGREALREELRPLAEFRAPYEQRDWTRFKKTGNAMQIVLPSGVRRMIPYKGKLVIKTGGTGGLYTYPPLKELYVPKEPGYYREGWDGMYVPGDGLDVLAFVEYNAIEVVKPDLSVDIIKIPGAGDGAGCAIEDPRNAYIYSSHWNGRIYRVNLETKTYELITTAPPGTLSRGLVYSGGRLYAGAESGEVGIWEYDISTGVWSKKVADIHIFGCDWVAKAFWAWGHIDYKKRVIIRSTDMTTFEVNIVPQVLTCGGWMGRPLQMRAYAGALFPFYGVIYALREGVDDGFVPTIYPICSYVRDIVDLAIYNGMLALGYDELFWTLRRDLAPGSVELVSFSELLRAGLLPGQAIIWDSESIDAGDTSLPVVVGGWSRKTLMFLSNVAGTLTIETDIVGDGDWQTYDTISISADTPRWYMFTGDFARLRLSFDAAATVTAKMMLQP